VQSFFTIMKYSNPWKDRSLLRVYCLSEDKYSTIKKLFIFYETKQLQVVRLACISCISWTRQLFLEGRC